MNKTKFLTGLSEKLFGSSKRKLQDVIRLEAQKSQNESLGGFAIQFSKFMPLSLLPSLSKSKRNRVFSDEVTFWAWMSQILDFNASCSKALSRVQAWRAESNLSPISSKTAAYCKARKRLGIDFIRAVSLHLVKILNQRVTAEHLWHGHTVMSVDGSSVQLMDTEENQKVYPQPSNQKKNCGFPVMKFLGLLNHSTGAWEHHLTAHPDEHDARTMKKLINYFIEPCILLADRAFCSFEIIHRLKQRGVDSVMRLHQMRAQGFTLRKGKRIGKNQRLVTWVKPKYKPKHSDLSNEEWDALENTIEMRLIACWYEDRNGEKKRMILATTLLDTVQYDWLDLVNLYASRWDIELRIRDVKTTMKMEALNVQTPEMAKKSIAMALLGYNLVKAVSQEASLTSGEELKLISFKGVLDWINSTTTLFLNTSKKSLKSFNELYTKFLETASKKVIDRRPYRWEPRAIKKRPKPFTRLNESRKALKEKHKNGELIPALS